MSIKKLMEIIRRAEPQMNGEGYVDFVRYFMSLRDDEKEAIVKKYPNCFIKADLGLGRPIYFPLCNRHGMFSPCTIEWSINYANSLLDRANKEGNSDAIDQLNFVLSRLKRLLSMYAKDVPTPLGRDAYNKGRVTNMINQLQSDINSIRSKKRELNV